jgi:hypothetical protein
MSSPDDDLRSTEESILRDAQRLKELEGEKTAMDPTDPQVGPLADRIERIAAELKGKATAERELVEEAREPD